MFCFPLRESSRPRARGIGVSAARDVVEPLCLPPTTRFPRDVIFRPTNGFCENKSSAAFFCRHFLEPGLTDAVAGSLAAYGAHVVRGVHARLPHTRAHRTGA